MGVPRQEVVYPSLVDCRHLRVLAVPCLVRSCADSLPNGGQATSPHCRRFRRACYTSATSPKTSPKQTSAPSPLRTARFTPGPDRGPGPLRSTPTPHRWPWGPARRRRAIPPSAHIFTAGWWKNRSCAAPVSVAAARSGCSATGRICRRGLGLPRRLERQARGHGTAPLRFGPARCLLDVAERRRGPTPWCRVAWAHETTPGRVVATSRLHRRGGSGNRAADPDDVAQGAVWQLGSDWAALLADRAAPAHVAEAPGLCRVLLARGARHPPPPPPPPLPRLE